MTWTKGKMPRFHPLIIKGIWYVADGHADTEHSLAKPHDKEPCDSYEEALAQAAILNEDD